MPGRDQCQHRQRPLSLWDILPHELGKPLPLHFLLRAAVVLILFDDPHHLVPEYFGGRGVTAGEEFHFAISWTMALVHVHLLEHLHGDEGVLLIDGEEETIRDKRLVQVSPIFNVPVELFLGHHIVFHHCCVLNTILIINSY
jgi:hypothetical protein